MKLQVRANHQSLTLSAYNIRVEQWYLLIEEFDYDMQRTLTKSSSIINAVPRAMNALCFLMLDSTKSSRLLLCLQLLILPTSIPFLGEVTGVLNYDFPL